MQWRKLGHVYAPDGRNPKMLTHAAVPFAEPTGGDIFHVYFSSRDAQQRSHTGRLTLELGERPRVLDVEPEPVLSPGDLGCFDDSGAMLSWITHIGATRYFYYIGWNQGVSVPFRNSIGLAISENNGPPKRYAAGPIMDRTAFEPHFVASMCVLPDGPVWRMWYLSCTGWSMAHGKPQHHYHIKYAESDDGIEWCRHGRVVIEFASPDEYAISRPCVVRDENRWRMWYSYRGDRYKIGYAESDDGLTWYRRDQKVGIDKSSSGWDSAMVEYPFVIDHKGQRYMFYCGNGFGLSGFGLAVLED